MYGFSFFPRFMMLDEALYENPSQPLHPC